MAVQVLGCGSLPSACSSEQLSQRGLPRRLAGMPLGVKAASPAQRGSEESRLQSAGGSVAAQRWLEAAGSGAQGCSLPPPCTRHDVMSSSNVLKALLRVLQKTENGKKHD